MSHPSQARAIDSPPFFPLADPRLLEHHAGSQHLVDLFPQLQEELVGLKAMLFRGSPANEGKKVLDRQNKKRNKKSEAILSFILVLLCEEVFLLLRKRRYPLQRQKQVTMHIHKSARNRPQIKRPGPSFDAGQTWQASNVSAVQHLKEIGSQNPNWLKHAY